MGGHGHGHGHGHGDPYVVPDYRIYKVEDAPELLQVQKALASQGLKDPWLRNEVWRFNQKEFGTPRSRCMAFISRGFKWGVAATVITVALETLWDRMNPKDDHHEHGHH